MRSTLYSSSHPHPLQEKIFLKIAFSAIILILLPSLGATPHHLYVLTPFPHPLLYNLRVVEHDDTCYCWCYCLSYSPFISVVTLSLYSLGDLWFICHMWILFSSLYIYILVSFFSSLISKVLKPSPLRWCPLPFSFLYTPLPQSGCLGFGIEAPIF